MTNATSGQTTSFSDAECVQAFEHHDALLRKVQPGSAYRAQGADLVKARNAYRAYLPTLQPMGQHLLDRAIAALDSIRERVALPEGYVFRDVSDYHSRRFSTFIAGEFQLNADASLYIGPEDRAAVDESNCFGAEIRMFTRKVHAFVPAWIGEGVIRGRSIDLFDGGKGKRPFLYADSYEKLVDALVPQLQAALDALPPIPRLTTAESDEDESRLRP